jgi:hypothetical protein
MPSYFYRARDASGRAHEGIEIAASEEEVLRILENSQLIPVFIESRAPGGAAAVRGQLARRYQELLHRWRTSVAPVSVALFARQLSTMIGAGLPLVRSLRSIARDHQDKKLGAILERVAEDVQKGESLSAALAKHPGAFDEVFVSLVSTGEVSGTLDRIMDQTATYLERAEALRLKVQAALRYPTFVLSFAILILIAMIVKIIPMFANIYERFRVPLPIPTMILLSISKTVVANLLLFSALAVLATIGVWYALQTDAGRLWMDRVKFPRQSGPGAGHRGSTRSGRGRRFVVQGHERSRGLPRDAGADDRHRRGNRSVGRYAQSDGGLLRTARHGPGRRHEFARRTHRDRGPGRRRRCDAARAVHADFQPRAGDAVWPARALSLAGRADAHRGRNGRSDGRPGRGRSNAAGATRN